jgi:hypothetical protein
MFENMLYKNAFRLYRDETPGVWLDLREDL